MLSCECCHCSCLLYNHPKYLCVSALMKTHLIQKRMKGSSQKTAGKGINIVFDETCDIMDRSVLNIIGGDICVSCFMGEWGPIHEVADR